MCMRATLERMEFPIQPTHKMMNLMSVTPLFLSHKMQVAERRPWFPANIQKKQSTCVKCVGCDDLYCAIF